MTNLENAEKSIEKALKNFWRETYSKVNNYLSIQNENDNNNNKISIQIKSEPIDLNLNSKQPEIKSKLVLRISQKAFKQKETKKANNGNNSNKSFSTVNFLPKNQRVNTRTESLFGKEVI